MNTHCMTNTHDEYTWQIHITNTHDEYIWRIHDRYSPYDESLWQIHLTNLHDESSRRMLSVIWIRHADLSGESWWGFVRGFVRGLFRWLFEGFVEGFVGGFVKRFVTVLVREFDRQGVNQGFFQGIRYKDWSRIRRWSARNLPVRSDLLEVSTINSRSAEYINAKGDTTGDICNSGSSHCHHVIFLLAAKSQVVLPHTFKKKIYWPLVAIS